MFKPKQSISPEILGKSKFRFYGVYKKGQNSTMARNGSLFISILYHNFEFQILNFKFRIPKFVLRISELGIRNLELRSICHKGKW